MHIVEPRSALAVWLNIVTLKRLVALSEGGVLGCIPGEPYTLAGGYVVQRFKFVKPEIE